MPLHPHLSLAIPHSEGRGEERDGSKRGFSICKPFEIAISLKTLVPTKRVLGHDRCADHLSSPTHSGAMTVTRSSAGVHKNRGVAIGLGHLTDRRAGSLVELALLSIATSNPEHASTIGRRTGNNTDTDADRARPRRSAAAGSSIRSCISSIPIPASATAPSASRRGSSAFKGTAGGKRTRVSYNKWNCWVKQRHKGANRGILLIVKPGVGVVQHLSQIIDKIRRDVSQGNRGHVPGARGVIVWLDGMHSDI